MVTGVKVKFSKVVCLVVGQEKILKMLLQEEGNFLSGEVMSQTLGVSRTAVWKSIAQLRDQGYEIKSVQNKGYSLISSPDRLEKVAMSQGLEGQLIGRELICLASIDSTNSEVKRRAMAGAEEGLVVTAEEQTAGRGRRGRSFHSPSGTGLYFSVLLRPKCSVEELSNLTAWVAVAVAEGVETTCGTKPAIKWTNDLVLNGKKISGILTELSIESESGFVEYVVVGVGINVNHKKGDFPPDLEQTTSSIAIETGGTLCRACLCRDILLSLNKMISTFPQGKTAYLEAYRENCLTLGREVQVIVGEDRRPATAVGIDEEFRLLVDYPDGSQEALSAGEVSVRGMYGYI